MILADPKRKDHTDKDLAITVPSKRSRRYKINTQRLGHVEKLQWSLKDKLCLAAWHPALEQLRKGITVLNMRFPLLEE